MKTIEIQSNEKNMEILCEACVGPLILIPAYYITVHECTLCTCRHRYVYTHVCL